MNKKMKNCKSCNQEIAKTARICPNCGAKNKPSFLTGCLGFFIIIIILGVIFGTNTPKQKNVETKKETTETKKETKETKKAKDSVIGDTVALGDFQVTVNSTRRDNGTEYFKADAGNEIYYVDLTIENMSEKEQTISSLLMFKVVDAQGREQKQQLFVAGNGKLDGAIGAGRKMTGEYAVQIPVGTKGYELVFDGSVFSKGQIVIKLEQ